MSFFYFIHQQAVTLRRQFPEPRYNFASELATTCQCCIDLSMSVLAGSALSRRIRDREREIEADERDRRKEKDEVEELRRRLQVHSIVKLDYIISGLDLAYRIQHEIFKPILGGRTSIIGRFDPLVPLCYVIYIYLAPTSGGVP